MIPHVGGRKCCCIIDAQQAHTEIRGDILRHKHQLIILRQISADACLDSNQST